MNKLLQTTLISAILSMSVMAGEMTGALPKTIESGATVYVNKDIHVGVNDPATIDNYGSITTEVTEAPFPKITGANEREQTTINNHVGRSVKEETDTTNADAIKTSNPVTDVTLDKVYKIVDEGGGYVNENLQKENVNIVEVYDAEIKASDLVAYTDKDILYFGAEGADRTARIRGDTVVSHHIGIACNFGDQNADDSYALELMGNISIQGNLSNYKQGSITVKKDELNLNVPWINGEKQEIYVPVNVESGDICFMNGTIIHKSIDVSNEGGVIFDGDSVLKSDAVLRIGEAPTGA